MRVRKSYEVGEYSKYVNDTMPKSNLFSGILRAFIIGGGICVGGQMLRMLFLSGGYDLKTASAWVSVILIAIGSFLTAAGVYDVLGKLAGAGSIVPITGFANSIVASAMEYKHEGYILGVGTRLFAVAGPVLVYGFVAGVAAGLFYYFTGGGF